MLKTSLEPPRDDPRDYLESGAWTTVPCGHCGAPCRRLRSQLGRSRRFFCSHKCKGMGIGYYSSLGRLFQRTTLQPNGCIVWNGPVHGSGYGLLRKNCRTTRAHRVSWELVNGPIPDGLFVLHRCDNPACVNPDHLFLGTHADNMADSWRKGRSASLRFKGEGHPSVRLSDADVRAIRTQFRIGHTREIAEAFGCCESHIRKLVRGVTRAEAGGPVVSSLRATASKRD
jgi:hypothetical protein